VRQDEHGTRFEVGRFHTRDEADRVVAQYESGYPHHQAYFVEDVVEPEVDGDVTFFHGTRADLAVGDLIEPGFQSNFGQRPTANHVYFTAALDAAIWGAELAVGDGPGRIYVVEPTGPVEDDPNLTDTRFTGNPTRSYRSLDPLRVVAEHTDWTGHPPEIVQTMQANLARLAADGIEAIN
jgi:rifampin ADP-ribosylating transferase